MITPDGAGAETPTPRRIKRPELERKGGRPIRARTASKPKRAQEPSISEEVAGAVQRGYDIITENIRQGREAAERFREGEYRLREAPGDAAIASVRMLKLARELSTTTFDVLDRAVREISAAIVTAARARDEPLPGFRHSEGTSDRPLEAGRLTLTTRCLGHPKSVGHPTTIERPKGQAGPGDLTIDRLALRSGSSSASDITDVRFEVDLSQEGLIAVVTTCANHPPGIYSGMVYAKDQPAALGTMTVEIFE